MSLTWSEEAASCAEELVDFKNTSIDYVLFSVDNPKKKPSLILESKGKGGREKVAEILSSSDSQAKVLTGAFLASAIDERGSVVSVRRKVIHVSFVGSSVGVLTKGKVNGWSGSFRNKFPGSAIYLQLLGSDLDDLQESILESNLLACGGAHKPTRYDFSNATIIGSLDLQSNGGAASAAKKAAEEEAKIKAQGEAAKRKREEEAARKKAEEEKARLKREEEAVLRKAKEEQRIKEEKEAKIKAAEREARMKKEEEERLAKKKAEEERKEKEKAAEEARKKAEEERLAKEKAEEEARKKAEEERRKKKKRGPRPRPNLRSVVIPDKDGVEQNTLDLDDDGVVMLLSTQSGSKKQHNNIKTSKDLFKSMGVDPVIVDGADPSEKDTRDELFRMSGMRGNYPQFFVKKEGTDLNFFGDYETLEEKHNEGTLAEDMGIDIDASKMQHVLSPKAQGKKLILLISSMGNSEVKTKQNHVKSIIEGLGVRGSDMEILDCVIKDFKERRDSYWEISGIRARYPQLFATERDGKTTTFIGDYDQVALLHDQGSLGQEIGLV